MTPIQIAAQIDLAHQHAAAAELAYEECYRVTAYNVADAAAAADNAYFATQAALAAEAAMDAIPADEDSPAIRLAADAASDADAAADRARRLADRAARDYGTPSDRRTVRAAFDLYYNARNARLRAWGCL